jgi:hypothetical protein
MNIIMKTKLQISRILLLIFLTLPTVIFAKEDPKQIQIFFGDFFNNDRVTVLINKIKIVDNYNLTSDFSVGLTNLLLKGQLTGKRLIFVHNGKRFKCRYSNNIIELSIVMDDKNYSFTIDLVMGRFIDISKDDGAGLRLMQYERAPDYD